jgi:hypothetical protein
MIWWGSGNRKQLVLPTRAPPVEVAKTKSNQQNSRLPNEDGLVL